MTLDAETDSKPIIMAVPRLLSKPIRLSMLKNGVWCLSNLCRGKSPAPDFGKVGLIAPYTLPPSPLQMGRGELGHFCLCTFN